MKYDVYLFGDNDFGQLGFGDTHNRRNIIKHPSLSNIIDISKGGNHTFVKTSNNEIYAFGDNQYSQLGIESKNVESNMDGKQLTPIQVFQGNENNWCSNITTKPRAKSARK